MLAGGGPGRLQVWPIGLVLAAGALLTACSEKGQARLTGEEAPPTASAAAATPVSTSATTTVADAGIDRDAQPAIRTTDRGCEELAAVVERPAAPAWLDHLGTPIESTYMGRMGGKAWALPPRVGQRPVGGSSCVSMNGEDLYRFGCQACHGSSGAGAPPDIPSLVGAIRALSPSITRERFGAARASQALVAELTAQAATALHQRLHMGGTRMPAFGHFQPKEEEALLGYLKQLAGLPPSERHETQSMMAPAARVGELIVKGTCDICHGATVWHGRSPENVGTQMNAPALSTFATMPPERVVGAVLVGENGWFGPFERMPAFPYLTRAEAATIVLYLNEYPSVPPGD